MAGADNVERLKEALRMCARNDKTSYQHHEARPFDGAPPRPGTIWLTPREIARRELSEPDLATLSDALAQAATEAEQS